MAEANAAASLAVQEATALLYQASGTSPSSLPASIAPSTPDLGQINVVSTSYAVAQPGAIGDGWYLGYKSTINALTSVAESVARTLLR